MTSRTKNNVQRSLRRRYRSERRFRLFGMAAVCAAMAFLLFFFVTIISNGASAFTQTHMRLDFKAPAEFPEAWGVPELEGLSFRGFVRDSLRAQFPSVSERASLKDLNRLISPGAAYVLRDKLMANPELLRGGLSIWLPADDEVDMLLKGHLDRNVAEDKRRLTNQQLRWLDQLVADGRLERRFNRLLLTSGDSRDPELAGVWGAAAGSFFMLAITLALSFPLGVATAIYLEEFAPRNRWTDLVEVNINNLAAVPSIVFGLLGLALFINLAGLPRSAPLVGGLVLTLMTLPVIIITSRAALTAVPPSIREAALGVGASKMQMVAHHVLPLAIPGMLTGTILGMARALGESAPLLMIGMVAFIVDIPQGPLDPASALPVQIYLWADSPERAFAERTSAAIIVLLGFLLLMNAAAILLRKRFERRW
jgi:phosphate transport system permease protein